MGEYSGAVSGFDVFNQGLEKQQTELVRLLAEAPIRRTDKTVTVMQMNDIVEVTRRADVRSMDPNGKPMMGSHRPLPPLKVDGDEHRHYRQLLNPLFAPKAIAKLEAKVRQLANDLIDKFGEAGEVEFYGEFCVPLPVTVFLELLGLPLSDIDFLLWFKDAMIRPRDVDHQVEAGSKMKEYLNRVLDEREAEADPRDDLIASFMTAEVNGQRLTREDAIDITYVLIFGGLDTVSASLSCFVSWFARHPDLRQRVIEDPALLPEAIEELMRFESPVPRIRRYATTDFRLGDASIYAGDELQLLLCVANVDPGAVPDPLTVDFDRAAKRQIDFGTGIHRCLGSHLARMELRAALETLHQRIPDYAIDPKWQPRYHNNDGVRSVNPLHLVFTPSERHDVPSGSATRHS